MVKEIIWSAKALHDFKSIIEHLQEESVIYAEWFRSKILKSIERISYFPAIGRKVPEYAKMELREVFIWNYRFIYQMNKKNIIIVAIPHQKQNLPKTRWFL